MKANEFIKKFGLFTAKEYLAGSTIFDNHLMVFTNDCELNRLVESHELVKVWQLPEDDNDETGVDGARMYLECYAFYSTDEEKAKLDRLKQAIADVESCQ